MIQLNLNPFDTIGSTINIVKTLGVSEKRVAEFNENMSAVSAKLIMEGGPINDKSLTRIVEAASPETNEELAYIFFLLYPLAQEIVAVQHSPLGQLGALAEKMANNF